LVDERCELKPLRLPLQFCCSTWREIWFECGSE
jgi:hypothetical protein